MKAQVLYGINNLKYEENYNLPILEDSQILVKVKACGICGSDVDRVFINGTYKFPTIIGHEFSGEVVKVFSEKDNYLMNKRVSVFPLIPCKKCEHCKGGHFQLCDDYNYLGSRCDGGFAEYVSVPKWNVIEIPDCVSYEEAAMLEPAAVSLHAINAVGDIKGKKILITGSGTITSILVRILVNKGASLVVVLARDHEKLEYLKGKSPEIMTVNSSIEKLGELLKEVLNVSADIIIEATGSSFMLTKAIDFSQKKGVIIALGNPSEDIKLNKNDFWKILRKEIILKGSWNSSYGSEFSNDWKSVFQLLEDEKLRLADLISHRIKLQDLMVGLSLIKDKKEVSNKVMIIYE